ncbi:STAS domain-containing protein [Streptomyces violaceusniger]|uniref:STAS domain-containing protein n=1 Tax=Streptomyces violaceusniger TaxID=68280 RepID=A0A4D4KWM0_STRVO|nr:hypothetical protein SVIO_008360 [Streptomyces violaceusniger]
MTWSVPLAIRPRAALLSRRRRVLPSRLWAARAIDPSPGPSPIAIRCYSGCLVIEVRQEVGPAAEPHLGRLLHAAIRPGGTAVLVDLRRTAELGASGLSVLHLARTLADQHGLRFGFVGDVAGTSALSLPGRLRADRAAVVCADEAAQRQLPPAAAPSALPPAGG